MTFDHATADEEIQKTREATYGSPFPNMAGTSQQIAGLLTQMLANGAMKIDPSGQVSLANWAAPLFMVVVKLNRMGSGVPHEDNATDARVYMQFVQEMQKAAASAE
jgi:hypothetical protein